MQFLVLVFCVILIFGCTNMRESKKEMGIAIVEKAVEEKKAESTTEKYVTICSDSDGGQDLLVKGTSYKDQEQFEDSCTDTNWVDKYYCEGSVLKKKNRLCPPSYECSEGACIKKEGQLDSCEDSDGDTITRKGMIQKGTEKYEDSCTSIQNIKEYECNGNEIKSTIKACTRGMQCSEGACVPYKTTCTDKDNGLNLTIASEVTVDKGTGILDLYTDQCISDAVVREYYCDTTGNVQFTNSTCRTGSSCTQGACTEVIECSENDFGFDSRNKGTVTITERSKGGSVTRMYTDDCTSSTGIVTEYYCFQNEVAVQQVVCRIGCNNGACVGE